MSAATQTGAERLRWPLAFTIVLLAHATAGYLLLRREPWEMTFPPAAPILMDLPSEPAAPAAISPSTPAAVEPARSEPPPTAESPTPELAETAVPAAVMPAPALADPLPIPPVVPTDPELALAAPIPVPPVPLAEPPPPLPRVVRLQAAPHRPPARHVTRTEPTQATPSSEPAVAPTVTAAPRTEAAPAANPGATAAATNSWRALLFGRLLAAKRYPERARSRGDQGTALATFTMDRAGHVLGASLVRSSGSTLLDEEAVAMIHRAEPLPPLPDEMSGATLTLTVPVSFALR